MASALSLWNVYGTFISTFPAPAVGMPWLLASTEHAELRDSVFLGLYNYVEDPVRVQNTPPAPVLAFKTLNEIVGGVIYPNLSPAQQNSLVFHAKSLMAHTVPSYTFTLPAPANHLGYYDEIQIYFEPYAGTLLKGRLSLLQAIRY
jgi:hypothetical protein